jgi:hypothetical protein
MFGVMSLITYDLAKHKLSSACCEGFETMPPVAKLSLWCPGVNLA